MRKLRNIIRDVFIGVTTYDTIHSLQRKRFQSECLLMLSIMGDRLGLNTSCYYKLIFIPYWMKRFKQFEEELLREKDFFEKIS
jgi:hypothetical protein